VNDTGNLTVEKIQFGYVDSFYLTAARDLFAPVKQRSYELMGDIVNKDILDIGCGPGLDTVAMAKLVGKKGLVEGVDNDPAMIQEAESRATANHVNDRVTHHVASATQLPFADNHFDAVRSERLFMHLTEVECALAEAARVTKPGGRLVVADTDWGSLSTNTGADDIERRLVQFRAETFLANGYSGRRLYGLFTALSLRDIRVETVALHTTDLTLWMLLTKTNQVTDVARERKILTDEEVQYWKNALIRSSEMEAFFGSVNVVMVSGTALEK
jgi:SAM-dependent methyltransferase